MVLIGWAVGCFVGWVAAAGILAAIPGNQGFLLVAEITAPLTIIGGGTGVALALGLRTFR